MVLFGSVALVLVVVSVVCTVYFVNRPSIAAHDVSVTPAPVASPMPPAPVVAEASAPPLVAPTIDPPVSVPLSAASAGPAPVRPPVSLSAPADSPTPAPEPTVTVPPPVVAPTVPSVLAEHAVTTPETLGPTPTLAPDAPDERVREFVESVRVTGIRSSGADSRVLMNERVYRVNDIVERTLNVRLINAAADSLTFADERGVTYVKRF
jgi:hypothetical protein